MQRAYFKWFSPQLQKDMELLVFGHTGARVLFFPTRGARFYDYENWKVIDAISDKIANGQLQVICVDSVDHESFYNRCTPPAQRIQRHLQYEQYIINEVLPFTEANNPGSEVYAAGCSLGAYHAVNIAFKYPDLFIKAVGMSGRYDLTVPRGVFIDLFDGYTDDDIYFNMPNQYVANLEAADIIDKLKQLDIIIAIGNEDVFLDDSKHLSNTLWDKEIWNALHIWDGEAHKPKFWRKMVQIYF
jgi:esterase/lipase superfamily enzyme